MSVDLLTLVCILTGDTPLHPPAPPRRSRMDRILKRAQSNLEAKFRRDRGNSNDSGAPGSSPSIGDSPHTPRIMTPGMRKSMASVPVENPNAPRLLSTKKGGDSENIGASVPESPAKHLPKMMPLGTSGRGFGVRSPTGGHNSDVGVHMHVPKMMHPSAKTVPNAGTAEQSAHVPKTVQANSEQSAHAPKIMQSGGPRRRRERVTSQGDVAKSASDGVTNVNSNEGKTKRDQTGNHSNGKVIWLY